MRTPPRLTPAFPSEGRRWKEGRERDTREREPRGVPLQRAANAAPGLNRKEFPLPRPLRLGGSHLSPGCLSRAFRFVRIYKAGMPACYDVKASPFIQNHPLPRPRTDKPSEWCRKRSEFPMPPILSLKFPASPSHRHTLLFLDAQEHTGCAFLRSHVPRARKGPLTDLLSQSSSGKRERGSRENTQPPVVALGSGKSDEKRMRNETGSSPRPTAHPRGGSASNSPRTSEAPRSVPTLPTFLSDSPQSDPTRPASPDLTWK